MADEGSSKGRGASPPRYGDPFQSFRTEMDRLFENFLSGVPQLAGFRQGVPADHGLTPSLDVKETDKELVVKADLPGIEEKDLQLTVHNGQLRISGEKKSEKSEEHENYYVKERNFGSFTRTIPLPDTIDEDKVEATFDNGVLTVTLAKKDDHIKPQKKIEIKSGQTST
ncbi:molecular chaperone Hsp20 [Rhodomicrobium udaipurense JA643]|uniref:Hsp20/alpha crystallin family protein n=1 Tax=Rhodomicrobium udaipurense TaxID=1202716 RepID=A0A8I1GHE9_9HYPH|nr:Hsp20/alpha crystallin family protein [Rhodomicrobium udaipurense]KAI94979.1 molecular chaperone Hsp20 [Rhodomicrobium udaipurense JA643]MBJ7544919.1 Hsp20/alpha crystallin family protein [Rhodomicrobium udaipurense]